MENVRSGNLKVSSMKKEIDQNIILLEVAYKNPRIERQIRDGTLFLDMIAKPPYATCRTVSKLKKKISEEREKLKQELRNLDYHMPGHQFSIFETEEEVSEEERKELEYKKIELKDQIRWLHKCLGMCSNKDYFK